MSDGHERCRRIEADITRRAEAAESSLAEARAETTAALAELEVQRNHRERVFAALGHGADEELWRPGYLWADEAARHIREAAQARQERDEARRELDEARIARPSPKGPSRRECPACPETF